MSPETRIGFIEVSTSATMSAELPRAMPPGAIAVFARLRLPAGEVSIGSLDTMVRTTALEEAAQQLADADVDVITLGCTSASLLHGAEWEATLTKRLSRAAGVPASTTASAVVRALRAVGARQLSIATPYPEPVNDAEVQYLRSYGFVVAHIHGLGLSTDREIGALTKDDIARLAGVAAATPSDAVLLSCTSLRTGGLAPHLAAASGRPVISSNSATLWDSLRLAGIPATDPTVACLTPLNLNMKETV